MNPKFLKVVRELVKAGVFHEDAALNPLDIDAYIREETKGEFGLTEAQEMLASISSDINAKNLGRSAVQGALFNFGDEIVGALPGGEERAEKMRLEEDLFRQAHPIADAAAGMVGGAVVPGGMMARGVRTAAALPRASILAAGAGALSSAGAAEPGERLPAAGRGAGYGAVLGPIVPGAVRGAKAVAGMRPGMGAVSDAVSIARSGGATLPYIALQRALKEAEKKAGRRTRNIPKVSGLQSNIDMLIEGLLKPARPLGERVTRTAVPIGMGGLLSDY